MFTYQSATRPGSGLWRRVLALLVALAALLPLCLAHAETAEIVVEAVSQTGRVAGGLSNDEAAAGYINSILYPDARRPRSANLGAKLTGNDAAMFRILKDKIMAVAAGDSGENVMSTQFDIPAVEILGVESYAPEDFGLSTFFDGDYISDAAYNAFTEKSFVDFPAVVKALMHDYPFEMYWFDKTVTGGYPYNACPGFSASYDGRNESLCDFSDYSITFRVAKEYSATNETGTSSFLTSKGQSVRNAVNNAKAIVDANASGSDIEKLTAYKEAICDAVSYNNDAANDEIDTPYGNPWQLVWVFDGDPDTKVVCEGYSKAFQYLCDLSAFQGDVSAICATGLLGSVGGMADGAGAHMWNIVTMNNGRNYLVDVTNCDGSSIGNPDWLFMKGYADYGEAAGLTQNDYKRLNRNAPVEKYSYDCEADGSVQAWYIYDADTLKTFGGTGRLELSDADYSAAEDPVTPPAPAPGGAWGDLAWTLDGDTLTITGTGPMKDGDVGDSPDTHNYPWNGLPGSEDMTIRKVVIGEGVTSIAKEAFAQLPGLETVALPGTLTLIDKEAFRASANLSEVTLPKGLKTLGDCAFSGCEKLPALTLPEGLESIGGEAFFQCFSLKELVLPASLKEIGESLFGSDQRLSDPIVRFASEPESMTLTDDGLLIADVARIYNRDTLEYESVEKRTAVYLNPGSSRVTIPDGVERIAASAMACRDGLDVTLPDSVTALDDDAFLYSTRVTFHCHGNAPAYAYAWANDFTVEFIPYENTLILPDGTTTIDSQAFAGLGVPVNVVIPAQVTSIAKDTFDGSDVLLWYEAGTPGATAVEAYLAEQDPAAVPVPTAASDTVNATP